MVPCVCKEYAKEMTEVFTSFRDPTELGTNFSTVIGKNGVVLCCRDPLDQSSPWVGKDPESGEEVSIESEVVQDDMGRIGAELAMLQMSTSL